MPTLTQAQIDELERISLIDVNNFTNQDAIDYYTTLSNAGFKYGELALGVVRNDVGAGKFANAFAKSVADDKDIDFSVGSANWIKMQGNLIKQDYLARDGNFSQELSWKIHDANHTIAFQSVGLGAETWTVHAPLTYSDPAAADAAWVSFLDEDGFMEHWAVDGVQTFINTLGNQNDIESQAIWRYHAIDSFAEFTQAEFLSFYSYLNDPVATTGNYNNLISVHSDIQTLLSTAALTGYAVSDIISNFSQNISNVINGVGNTVIDLSSFISNLVASQNAAQDVVTRRVDPLIFDLDGDGVELLTVDNGVYWDLDQDDFVEQAGWVAPDDGLLAFDQNGDGVISDQNELFGTDTQVTMFLMETMETTH